MLEYLLNFNTLNQTSLIISSTRLAAGRVGNIEGSFVYSGIAVLELFRLE